ncbi:MAG: phosphoribosylformylglycinamidine cyclo-ligase [Sulfurospirillum sp.]|nr:phosphoribosylformylglycinamidine cyclo-ligase [Sulfurospirillum sp.]
MSTLSYKDAGVDVDVGNLFIEKIKPLVKSTFDSNVIGGIGSFAGMYELPTGYKNPVILGATDGVGTKLKLAIESKKYDTIGIDLVAMCVNDIICNFGTPLFFLDYYATGKLDIEVSTAIIKGIAQACKESQCSLIGGETAEMPNMYRDKDFDLAGFSVGIAEKNEVDRLSHVKAGDILIALKSSGIHSNGYSLVRKLFFNKLGYTFETLIDGKPLIDTLLTPTKLYVKIFKKLKNKINALAHITGGGIIENLPRVLPKHVHAVLYKNKIETLRIFDIMSEHVSESEMYRTFNMGIGMILVVSPENVDYILSNSNGYIVGEIKEGQKKIMLK